MKKRIVSILTVICILISAVPALAFYPTGTPIPEIGVLCFHDFEDIPASAAINASTYLQGYTAGAYTGGDMFYANGFVLEEADGNNYFRHGSAGANLKYGLRDRQDTSHSDSNDYFNEGLLKLQYDVMVPATESTTEQAIYYQVSNNLDGSKYRAYLNSVISTADGVKAVFATSLNRDARPTVDNEYVAIKELENDKWYTITMIVDYENGKVFQFLDGVRVAAFANTVENVKDYCGFSYGGLSQVGQPEKGKESEYIRIDNFLVERIAADNVKAKVVNYGTNYADVEFDAVVLENGTYTASNFALNAIDGTVAPAVSEVTKLALNKFRITFAEELAKGATYELIINADVSEAGTQNKMVKGAKLFFTTQAEGQNILAMDFNLGWPSEENGYNGDAPSTAEQAEAFTKYYYVGSDGTNDFAASKAELVGHAGITTGGDGVTGDNYRVLSVTHKGLDMVDNTHQSIVIPFTGVESVDSGIIEAEFEALIEPNSTGYFDVAFGLHDTKNTATTYNYDTTWADATQFVGLVNAKSNLKYLVPGIPESKGKVASKWADRTEGKINSSTWNDKYILESGITERVNTTPDYDKFKFVVDLDKDIFEIYFNGAKKYTSDYMPGRVNDGVYDAFVITTNRGQSTTSCWLYFDNLKVTHFEKQFAIEDIEFQSGAQKYSYANTVDYKINRMKITMSKEISDSIVNDYVSFSGDDMYFIYAEGKDIFVEFEEGLTYNKDYTVTLSKDLVSEDGVALGTDVVLSFKTIGDDITYGNPIITYDGDILEDLSAIEKDGKIEVTVNTKSGISCGALIMVAAYKGGKLSGVAADNITSSSGKLVLSCTADDGFVGANEIKAFVLDGTVLKPITTAAVVE